MSTPRRPEPLDVDGSIEQRQRIPAQLDALDAKLERFCPHRDPTEHERSGEPALYRCDRDVRRQSRRDALPDELQAALGARCPDQHAGRDEQRGERDRHQRQRGLEQQALHKSDPMVKCSR